MLPTIIQQLQFIIIIIIIIIIDTVISFSRTIKLMAFWL